MCGDTMTCDEFARLIQRDPSACSNMDIGFSEKNYTKVAVEACHHLRPGHSSDCPAAVSRQVWVSAFMCPSTNRQPYAQRGRASGRVRDRTARRSPGPRKPSYSHPEFDEGWAFASVTCLQRQGFRSPFAFSIRFGRSDLLVQRDVSVSAIGGGPNIEIFPEKL